MTVTPERVESTSLCGICARRWTCVLRRQLAAPVLHCPEYVAGDARTAVPRPTAGDSENDTNHYDDLCHTCLNRAECTDVHPPGGVWHCESYIEGGGQ